MRVSRPRLAFCIHKASIWYTEPSQVVRLYGHSLAGGEGGLGQARAHGDQKTEPLGQRHHGRGDHPGILAGSSGGQQCAEIAELVGGACDLRQIAERHVAGAGLAAEIAAVAAGRQEPADVGPLGGGWQLRSIRHGVFPEGMFLGLAVRWREAGVGKGMEDGAPGLVATGRVHSI